MSIYRIGAHESQVLIWLAWKRFHGKDPATVKHPLSVATLKNHLGSLRRALFECNCPDLPPWAKWKDKHGACVLNQLFEWKLQDARSSLEKPQQEKTFLVSSEVELYCLKVLEQFWCGDGATDFQICTALLLRIQAGSNQRSGNLLRDCLWRDVKYSPPAWPVMDLIFTKLGGSQTAAALGTKLKVKRHLDDKLSFNLFKIWHDKHKANVQPHHHFFPQFLQKQSTINWDTDLGNNSHSEAVKTCAQVVRGLSPEETQAFTSTSVSRRAKSKTFAPCTQELKQH